MSPRDESAPRRASVLKAFAAVPERAANDVRLKDRHWRVLSALCRAGNVETGCVFLSYRGLGKLARYKYQKIGRVLTDLGEWGYIRIIKRGRHTAGPMRGRYKTPIYQILYELPAAGVASTQAVEPVPPQGGTGLDPRASTPLRGYRASTPSGGYISRDTRVKQEEAAAIFRTSADSDRFDDHVEVAQQLELPLPEVQRLDLLRQRAVQRFGFPKIVQLEQRLHNKLCVLGTATRNDYYRALREKLEEMVVESEAQARNGCTG